jgi:antitoxin (DNA-binding transcriptional repressor) of toxin-antitoxin stability system
MKDRDHYSAGYILHNLGAMMAKVEIEGVPLTVTHGGRAVARFVPIVKVSRAGKASREEALKMSRAVGVDGRHLDEWQAANPFEVDDVGRTTHPLAAVFSEVAHSSPPPAGDEYEQRDPEDYDTNPEEQPPHD